MRHQKGFTIVELLIVIVVIAILAAVTIVAYNGVQARAYNTKVISGTSQYVKAFLEYKTVNGTYPSTSGCLGANYPNNACWANAANGTSPLQVVNSSLDVSLNEFIPSKPEVGIELINIVIVPQFRGGLVYLPGDSTYGFRFTYYLKGNNENCGLRVASRVNEGPLTQCNLSLPQE